jgi:hypothetical protein
VNDFNVNKRQIVTINNLSLDDFNDHLIRSLIISGGLSMNNLENPGFLEFLRPFWNKQIVSRNNIRAFKLPEYELEVRGKIIEVLKTVSKVCLTVDLWSDRS